MWQIVKWNLEKEQWLGQLALKTGKKLKPITRARIPAIPMPASMNL